MLKKLLATAALVATLAACGGTSTGTPTADTASKSNGPVATAPAKPKETGTVSQREALDAAQSYLDTMGFSKKGLMEQLTSNYGDGFTKADAAWAIAHLKVDWNAEAVEAGKSYLETGSFSRKEMIDQLSSPYGDQFTKAQATYAADKLGL